MKMPDDFAKLQAAMSAITVVDQMLSVLSRVKFYEYEDSNKMYVVIEADSSDKDAILALADQTLRLIKSFDKKKEDKK